MNLNVRAVIAVGLLAATVGVLATIVVQELGVGSEASSPPPTSVVTSTSSAPTSSWPAGFPTEFTGVTTVEVGTDIAAGTYQTDGTDDPAVGVGCLVMVWPRWTPDSGATEPRFSEVTTGPVTITVTDGETVQVGPCRWYRTA